MEDITAFGQSDPTNALKRTIANKADAIVLVTAKGLELEPALVQQALKIRKSSPARSTPSGSASRQRRFEGHREKDRRRIQDSVGVDALEPTPNNRSFGAVIDVP